MRVNVAGEIISLTVGFDEQDFVRDTESRIAELFDTWQKRFPTKPVKELLAMMTYQYASYYMALSHRHADMLRMLADCDSHLNEQLLKAPDASDGNEPF